MASTYSNLKIQLMATGENSGAWGDVTNVNLGTALEEAIAESATVTFADANQTLTLTDSNATQTARHFRLFLTGSATSGYNLVVPTIEKPYLVDNQTDGVITVKTSAGTGIAVPAGLTTLLYVDGTNVIDAVDYLTSLQSPDVTITNSATFNGATIADLGSVTTADINGGTIDGTVIGGTTAANVTASNLVATSADINGGTIDNTTVGATTPNSAVVTTANVTQTVTFSGVISPAQITASQNNYAPTGIGTTYEIRVDTDATGYDITGISASQVDGRELLLTNDGANAFTLTDEDANSTAANRFALQQDQNVVIQPGASVPLRYDGTASRWRIKGGTGSGGSGNPLQTIAFSRVY